VTDWPDKLHMVPEHLRGGVQRYLERGIQPGHFLTAVFENDLMEAMGRADEISRAGIFGICMFLYNYAPRQSYGSRDAVSRWLRQGGMQELVSRPADETGKAPNPS